MKGFRTIPANTHEEQSDHRAAFDKGCVPEGGIEVAKEGSADSIHLLEFKLNGFKSAASQRLVVEYTETS